jgi:MFS family permease
MFPALATLTSFATDADSQGSILGGSQVVGGLGRVVGPIWGGFLFQEVAARSPFLVAAALTIVAMLLAVRIPATLQSRHARGEVQEQVADAAVATDQAAAAQSG